MDDGDYINLTLEIRQSGRSSCDGLRIPLRLDINVQAWEKYTLVHRDPRLVQFLTYGFPLGMVSDPLNRSEIKNPYSAKAYPAAIRKYLSKEIQLGAILGPYAQLPSKECHLSSLMSRPKDEQDRRVIVCSVSADFVF